MQKRVGILTATLISIGLAAFPNVSVQARDLTVFVNASRESIGRRTRNATPWDRLEPVSTDRDIHVSLHFREHSPEAALYQGAGIGSSLRDAVRQGCRTRAYMDGSAGAPVTAIPQRGPDGRTARRD